jgi:hypothetical protein
MDLYEQILEDHDRKGEKSDIIIQWTLVALSKLSIRLPNVKDRVKKNLNEFNDHMNVEI